MDTPAMKTRVWNASRIDLAHHCPARDADPCRCLEMITCASINTLGIGGP